MGGTKRIPADSRASPRSCSVPDWVTAELRDQMKRSLPLIVALVLQLTFNLTVGIFVGRLGQLELAGAGLALTVISFTLYGMAQGMSTACDTLFSQAYGANERKMVGIYLQRGILFGVMFTCIVWSLYLVVEPCAVGLGIDPSVAAISAQYLLYYCPGIMCQAFFQILSKYLIAQYVITQVTVIVVVGNIINIAGHLLLVSYLQLQIVGSAIAMSVASASLVLVVLVYICATGFYKDTWPGWSTEAFHDWGMYARYALPGMAMLSLEYIGYEIGSVMSAILGPEYLSSFTVYGQISPLVFLVYQALATSVSFRVGSLLGCGDVPSAIRCARLAYTTTICISVIIMTLLTTLKTYIPLMFTDDPTTIEMSSEMIQVNVFYQFPVAISSVQFGVLRGGGRQSLGAYVHLVGYFVCSVPIGACLMFLTELKAVGFIVALVIGMWLEFVILTILLWFTDWEAQAQKVKSVMDTSRTSQHQKRDSHLSLVYCSHPALHSGSHYNLSETQKLRNEMTVEYGSTGKQQRLLDQRARGCSAGLVWKRGLTFSVLCLILSSAVVLKLVYSSSLPDLLSTTAETSTL